MLRTFENVTDLEKLIQSVAGDKPHKVTIGSTYVAIDIFEAGINFATNVSDAVGQINAMGKLHLVAQRIGDTRKRLDAEADKLAAKLDSLDAKAPEAFSRADAIIASQNADIDNMESELRQLSNLPST